MHLGIPALLDFYRAHRDENSLVLATIIGTEGSTYRKPGAMMLIAADGPFEGMISGGCLEGDLLQHAQEVFVSGTPKFVTYDMHADEDLAWSLGLGCDGIIHLLLQRLDAQSGFGFLQQLESAHGARQAALFALVTRSDGNPDTGSLALLDRTGTGHGEPALLEVLLELSGAWPGWRYSTVIREQGSADFEAMVIHMPVQTRVLICGAGPDAVPVAQALCGLDWDVHIVDHRPAYARAERFPVGCTVEQLRPDALSEQLDLGEINAAVIMSHHLENDAAYLRQLADADLAYIALLGPAARRARLLDMAGCESNRVFGPAGLDIGAELPGAIALSIAAEMHAVLNGRKGQPLTDLCHE